MFKKSYLGLAVAAAIGMPSLVNAEIETSVVLKNETAVFLKDGQRIGEASSTLDNSGDGREIYKTETSARIFFNGDIGEESSWHGELKIIGDPLAEDDYKWHKNYSQHDWFRELYVDTNAAGWDFRIGKQQQVWGTADGIKLLDIINPTDYREFSQNAMEDSRIPVWMITGERYLDNGGNIQFIVSQAERHKIPGLNNDGDQGHPFIMKGVDTITGAVNGFTNIGNAMGGVTGIFFGGGFTDPSDNPFSPFFTVGAYTSGSYAACDDPSVAGPIPGAACLENFTDNPAVLPPGFEPFSNNNVTNLIDVNPLTGEGWDPSNPNSVWEHMTGATFATFNTYVGITTAYERDDGDTFDSNLGGRYRFTFDNGLNLGVNYLYAYDPNPVVNIHWENAAGEKLVVNENPTVAGTNVVQLTNPAGDTFYGAPIQTYVDGNYLDGVGPLDLDAGATPGGPATLVFEETLERVHNIGSSFDYALDVSDIPLVIRGEFLYQKDVQQPVVDRNALARGNLTAALTTRDHDFFKYVIGVDATVMTNLLVSGQFIQFRNLDYVNSRVDGTGAPCTTANCGVYTADPATMSPTNGLQRGWENKEFYSLFLSKPFGESDLGRWNNIIIFEEGGGYWNRLDAEYSLSDEFVVTGEINLYWGDEDTTFGQFENSSNVQVGVKWIME